MTEASSYLLANQASELERLQLQSRVWEPSGRSLLAQLKPLSSPATAVDIGCGAMGWLRALSEWTGAGGYVVGTDVDDRMLAAAQAFVTQEALANVSVRKDDLFASGLPPASFDLVHARFQIAPLGRAREQLTAYVALAKPGGLIVIEDPDMSSWKVTPDAPAVRQLIDLIRRGFLAAGGNFDAGRDLPALMTSFDLVPHLRAEILALEHGHPYLRLPLQFAQSLRPRLRTLVPEEELDALMARAREELDRPDTWGTTFTLIQAYARRER